MLFGVSIALGAFFAGMVLAGSPLSQRAAEETLPLRDAFAVLFFVSVGMLFNPTVLSTSRWRWLATWRIIVLGGRRCYRSCCACSAIERAPRLTIAVSLAQIGEFSFILADLGIGLGLMPEARDLMLGASILSIFLNPLLFALLDRFGPRVRRREPVVAGPAGVAVVPEPEAIVPTSLTGHTVLVGFGRVGRLVADGLRGMQRPLFVIDTGDDALRSLHAVSVEAIAGNAADPEILSTANIQAAELLILAIPDAFEAGQVAEQARKLNGSIRIIARAHFDAAVDHLETLGVDVVVMGEREIARTMLTHADIMHGSTEAAPQIDKAAADPTARV